MSGTSKKRKRGTSQNRGLPGHIIEKYGEEVQWSLISDQTWNEFYKTPEGQARLKRMIAKTQKKVNAQQGKIDDDTKPLALRTKEAVNLIQQNNEKAKNQAKTKKRKYEEQKP
jgi:hypothetical protein